MDKTQGKVFMKNLIFSDRAGVFSLLRDSVLFNTQNLLNPSLMIAHRGGAHEAPENTLEAFRNAINFGSAMCEFDVQLTQDNYLVVIHDETVDRTTSGTGRVQDLTLNQIQSLDAGSWKDPKFAGARVPTLDQVMELFLDKNCRTKINIEIKASKNIGPNSEAQNSQIQNSQLQNQKITKAVIQWLKNLNPKFYSRIIISSFFTEGLFEIRKNFSPSDIALGYLCFIKSWDQDWPRLKNKISEDLQALSCVSFNINAEILTLESIKQIKKIMEIFSVPYLLAYTVNDLKTIQSLFSAGVNGFFSDFLNPA